MQEERTVSIRLRTTVTIVYLLCIYTTLGIVRPAAEFLRTQGVLAATISVLFALFIPAVLTWRYRTSGRSRLLLRICLILILLTITFFLSGLPEERLHFLTYGLLGWLISWTFEAAASSKKFYTEAAGWLLSCLLVWLAGVGDELIQWLLPMRVFDLRDIVFNGMAGMAGIAIFATDGQKKPET